MWELDLVVLTSEELCLQFLFSLRFRVSGLGFEVWGLGFRGTFHLRKRTLNPKP